MLIVKPSPPAGRMRQPLVRIKVKLDVHQKLRTVRSNL